jgi:hypothetical protein
MEDEFREYKIWIEKTLERFEKTLTEIKHDLTEIRSDLSAMKVKAGVWGLIGSAIPVCIGLAVYLFKLLIN